MCLCVREKEGLCLCVREKEGLLSYPKILKRKSNFFLICLGRGTVQSELRLFFFKLSITLLKEQ